MEHTAHGYWLTEAPQPDPLPPLAGAVSADVAIVGGGYTGLWAAWHILQAEPETGVVVLEADRCGFGPSGRNGGFVNAMWFSLATMRARFGDDQALRVARAAQEAVDGVGRFCSDQEVDAWFRQSGYLQVSAAPAQDGVWGEALLACEQLGVSERGRELDGDEVQAICASPRFRGGAFYPGAATVQPARLAHGLRERVLAAGARIYERSPVRALSGGAGGCTVRVPGGEVRAGTVLLCAGGAPSGHRAPLRGRVTITSSHIALTEPVPELIEEIGWTGGECITDGRTLLHYFRTTPEGRIAFGWGGGRIALGARMHGSTEVDPGVIEQVRRDLLAFFPGLEGRRITHAWGGPIDASPAHMPVVMPLRGDRAFAAFGYTGNGVGPSHMLGRTLASLALGRADEHATLPLVEPAPRRVPAGIAGWAGGNAIRAGIEIKERAEERGEDPPPWSVAVASVPQLIGFHIGR